MTRALDVYYDFLSPYSYLAFTRLPALTERTGAVVSLKPVDVFEVMKRVGNTPTSVLCAAKGRYAVTDLARWASRYGVPIARNPHLLSMPGRPLLLGAVAAAGSGRIEAYSQAIFEAIWTRRAALTDDAAILDALQAGGFEDGDAVLAARDAAGEALDALIEEAVSRGVFGVPSFSVGEALYFGNDRLEFVEEALGR